jgi:hypothetical protein
MVRLSPHIWIRVAAALFGALTVGHLSAYPWTSTRITDEVQLVSSMKTVEFVFAGERQTYWGLYFGWGLLVALLLFSTAITLWLVSDLVGVAPRRVGLITGVILATSLLGCLISVRFFYVPPAVFYAAVSVVLAAPTIQLIRCNRKTPIGGRSAIDGY